MMLPNTVSTTDFSDMTGLPVPLFSLIIPVLHDAAVLDQTLDYLMTHNFHKQAEIIVVDGDPNGTSIGAISHPDIRITVGPKGRANQMNYGAAIARGQILIFLHADTWPDPDALEQIYHACIECEYAAGAFQLKIRSGKMRFRIIEMGIALRNWLTRIPYGDQMIFIQRRVFESIGGYAPIPLMEDIHLIKQIKKHGWEIRLVDGYVHTSARRWEAEGVVCCTLRNWILAIFFHLGVSPERLATYYHF